MIQFITDKISNTIMQCIKSNGEVLLTTHCNQMKSMYETG